MQPNHLDAADTKTLLGIAKSMMRHGQRNLASNIRSHLGHCLMALDDPRYFEEISEQFGLKDYRLLVRSFTDRSYLVQWWHQPNERLRDAPFEHVLFHMAFTLILFERVVQPDSRYHGPVHLKEEDKHGTLTELLEVLLVISEGKRITEDVVSTRLTFNEFMAKETDPEAIRKMTAILGDSLRIALKKSHSKSWPIEIAGWVEPLTDARQKELHQHLVQVGWLMLATSPAMPHFYPNQPNVLDVHANKLVREGVPAAPCPRAQKLHSVPKETFPPPPPGLMTVPPGFEHLRPTVKETNVEVETPEDLEEDNEASSSSTEGQYYCGDDFCEEDEDTEVEVEVFPVESHYKEDEELKFKELVEEAVANIPGVKIIGKEDQWENLASIVTPPKYLYDHIQTIQRIDFARVKINLPPDHNDISRATVATPLLTWKGLPKEFKTLRAKMMQAAEKKKLQLPQLFKGHFEKLFFTAFALVSVADYKYSFFMEFMASTLADEVRATKDPKQLKLYLELAKDCRLTAARMKAMRFKAIAVESWMSGKINLKDVITKAELDMAEPGASHGWIFEVNEEACRRRARNPEDVTPTSDFIWEPVLSWTTLGHWLGCWSENSELTQLSPSKTSGLLHATGQTETGLRGKSYLLVNLWEPEIREKHGLPEKMVINLLHALDPQISKFEDRVILFDLDVKISQLLTQRRKGSVCPPVCYSRSSDHELFLTTRLAVKLEKFEEPPRDKPEFWLTTAQTNQVIDKLVTFHQICGFDETVQGVSSVRLTVPEESLYVQFCVKLVGLFDPANKPLLTRIIDASTLFYAVGSDYKDICQTADLKYGVYVLHSHGSLRMEGLIFSEGASGDASTTTVKYLSNFAKVCLAPVGYDLAHLLYNLVNPSTGDFSAVISTYTDKLNEVRGRFTKVLQNYEVGRMVTVYGPMISFVSFYNSVEKYETEFLDEKTSAARKADITELWLARGRSFVKATSKYQNLRKSEEFMEHKKSQLLEKVPEQ